MKILAASINKWPPTLEKLLFGIYIFILLVCTIIAISQVAVGNFAFWYDPARDLLSALHNLSKPTLLGNPTGIPGVFYGPYWIWLLSFGLLINKDPRYALFVVGIIPYIILFPFFFSKFSKILGRKTVFILLVFFALGGFLNYTTNLWNPNLAPFFFILLILSLMSFSFSHLSFKTYLFAFLSGASLGLIMNFNLSFGIGVAGGVSLYMIVSLLIAIRQYKKLSLKNILLTLNIFLFYIAGILFIFLPFILFELRHNFLQTHYIYSAFANTVFYNSAQVGQIGFNKILILRTFFGAFGSTIHVNEFFVYIGLIAIPIYIFILWTKKKLNHFLITVKKQLLTTPKGKLLSILLIILFSTFFMYISSKNPVWAYYFIGMDILFLLIFGVIMSVFPKIQQIIFLWSIVVIIGAVPNLYFGFLHIAKLDTNISSLATKKMTVEQIYKDAKSQPFFVASYNPALYTYDYDYLFKWIGNKSLTNNPKEVISSNLPIYLIVPRKEPAATANFVDYMSTPSAFITTKFWTVGGDIEVIKREKKKIGRQTIN